MRALFSNLFILIFFCGIANATEDTIHHELSVKLTPGTHTLTVTDRLTLPKGFPHSDVIFSLNQNLKIASTDSKVELLSGNITAQDIGIDREDNAGQNKVRVNHYIIRGIKEKRQFTLTYQGKIFYPVQQQNEEYARSFSQSPGLIDQKGVYLAGATYWIPTLKDRMVTYDLSVTLPSDWSSISQGKIKPERLSNEVKSDGWRVETPTEEIYLIAAPFTRYQKSIGGVTAMAYLRTPDDALADKYIGVTSQYMDMYRQILGPYPYSKFAIVENFWETGYGMPSFTLLGSKVIRFPFILHSSYPHELLHNWWGNGVFVNFAHGNWCEGLTSYLADHLIAEQRNKGTAYRRTALQRYTDYVTPKTDFPLKRFLSRHNAVTEAVGYGKTLMMWHMLRQKVGDDKFLAAFQNFYKEHKFKKASFDDIRKSFDLVSGQKNSAFFDQWINRKGAPLLHLRSPARARTAGKWQVSFSLQQSQKESAFSLDVPVMIYSKDKVSRHIIPMTTKEQAFTLTSQEEPLKIAIDPEFDLFRKLHKEEVPPSLSKIFGAEKILILLPSEARKSVQDRYKEIANIWQKENITIHLDTEFDTLPTGAALWIMGSNNKFSPQVKQEIKPYDARISDTDVYINDRILPLENHSTVILSHNPDDQNQVMAFLSIHDQNAVAGLARKLPHYGKYSYLAFTGTAPDNMVKGEWQARQTPLTMTFKNQKTARPIKRKPLATLKPLFSDTRLKRHMETLTSPEMEGRGLGTKGLQKAADYIVTEFKRMGLMPAGDKGTYFQKFSVKGPDDKLIKTTNIVAALPGKKTTLEGQSVVLSAHYDHLGFGWPDVAADNKGQRHDGADDNASGVAVMLEIAEILSKSTPDRTILFAAFSAEEAGLQGSRYYVTHAKTYPIEKTIANLNLDTVGRLGEKKLTIFGGETAREWRFIFMGTTAVTGVDTALSAAPLAASDNVSFSEIGIPSVQLFGSDALHYHKPEDRSDTIDITGMIKVATVAREVINYLSTRPEKLTSKLTSPGQPAATSSAKTSKQRKVSTGIMPDFTFPGPGIKVTSVSPESAAANAGIQAGDIILKLGKHKITGLRNYATQLAVYHPGDIVEFTIARNGTPLATSVKLDTR